jgi:tRNA pseudouridine38/39 synthase
MMALLLLVGQGLEEPTITRDILDISKHPKNAGRPIYEMAPDGPLCLVDCG